MASFLAALRMLVYKQATNGQLVDFVELADNACNIELSIMPISAGCVNSRLLHRHLYYMCA
jgi:hypothetical protein